ncbi:MAG: regulatory protein RecX [Clostridia bacterium]|nr:regulatory protein RecX [Clostridia bacterium]
MNLKKVLTTEEDKNTFTIHFDDGEKLSVLKETYFKYSLYELTEIDSAKLEEIINNNDLLNCENTARKNLTGTIKSSNRLFLMLESKGFKEETIHAVIDILEKDGSLNDQLYAKKFINKKLKGNKISKNMLLSLLINEGYDEQLSMALVDEQEINDYENAKILVEKKYKGKVKEIKKIYRYLLSKGYDRDVIFAVLGKDI